MTGTDRPSKNHGPRIFLIRHADSSGGPKDPDRGGPLSALGRRQAQALARRIARWQVDAIFCSDMHRTVETANAVHAYHPQVPLHVDARLRELSARKIAAYEAHDPAQSNLVARMEVAWQMIVTMPYEVAVVIIHNGLIKYLLGRTIDYGPSLKPRFHSSHTGITALQVRTNGRALVQFFNDTHHLTPDLATAHKAPWIEDPATGHWGFLVETDEAPEGDD